VEKIVLFGSRARGDARERSDIDLAVFGPNITSREWQLILDYVEEEARTLLSVDLLRFENTPSDIRKSIEKEGVILYERHPTSRVLDKGSFA
jgi:predicted nucleotidyltransferase